MTYFLEFGKEGLFERVVNRTVRQIIEQFDKSANIELEKAGELDGKSFKLYSASNGHQVDPE